MYLDGRPPVAVGVTSGGNIFGGTQVTFSDVLGDQQFNIFASSISQYRTISGSYISLKRRFQFALQGYTQSEFYYGAYAGTLYDPGLGFLDPDDAIATRTMRGGTAFGIYPFNKYNRVEVFGGVVNYEEEYDNEALQQYADAYQQQYYGGSVFRNGTAVPIGASFVRETTIFREFGPLAGDSIRATYSVSPKIGNSLQNQTVDVDGRYYLRLAGSGLLALRAKGFTSWGQDPNYFYFGGNQELRGYEYLEFAGNNGWFANAELRFPLVQAFLTPIGVLGGIRGTFFAGIGGAEFDGIDYTFATDKDLPYSPIIGYTFDAATQSFLPVYGEEQTISGFRLVDGRASYGVGLQTFMLGFPIHFDWSWKTLFNKQWEDALFAYDGGSSKFRRAKFSVWMGFDF
jgi:outer membrane protein assembly factor BamA